MRSMVTLCWLGSCHIGKEGPWNSLILDVAELPPFEPFSFYLSMSVVYVLSPWPSSYTHLNNPTFLCNFIVPILQVCSLHTLPQILFTTQQFFPGIWIKIMQLCINIARHWITVNWNTGRRYIIALTSVKLFEDMSCLGQISFLQSRLNIVHVCLFFLLPSVLLMCFEWTEPFLETAGHIKLSGLFSFITKDMRRSKGKVI